MVMLKVNADTAPRVAVIGGGAAGTLAALQLLERTRADVVVVEPARELGFGLPYRTRHPLHLLNVPAARMSAYPDRPDDFVAWLADRGLRTASAYVPRRLFGEYLHARLHEAGSGGARLTHVRGEATGIELYPEGLTVSLADGSGVAATHAVLAIGQPQERPQLGGAQADARHIVHDPWAPGALDRIGRGDSVLIVGTGLTMVDVVLELSERDVVFTAVSRRGLLPHAHRAIPPAPLPVEFPAGAGLGEIVRAVRVAAGSQEHWSPVVDGLRSLTHELWAELTAAEQSRFLRHLAPYWNVHRHRMPPQTAATIAGLRRGGSLRILAGNVRRVATDDTRLVADVQVRGQTEARLVVDHVVNCTGPRSQLRVEPPSLVRALLDSGAARLDEHGIGLDTSSHGALIDDEGVSSDRLHAIGALRRGTLLESTAIPELRAQAGHLADLFAASTAPGIAR